MSRGQTLRALVTERLAAAAEEVFALFERTILDYEEQNQRQQQLLDEVLNPKVVLPRAGVQTPLMSPDPELNQENSETSQFKEEPDEPSIKQEEEQLPLFVPESIAVCVSQESSLRQLGQTREETQGEDISSVPHFHSETEGHTEHSSVTDNDDDWETLFSCSTTQMEKEADGDHYSQAQSTDRNAKLTFPPETTVNNDDNWESPFSFSLSQMETEADGDQSNQAQIRDRRTKPSPQNTSISKITVHSDDLSRSDTQVERKKHQCLVCQKKYMRKRNLQRHMMVHAKEKPYSCSVCKKTFTLRCTLDSHIKSHTKGSDYSCSKCKTTFANPANLRAHRSKIHSRERPFSCSVCNKPFSYNSHLTAHMRIHTGERPFHCSICQSTFAQKSNLKAHVRTHTGEKPYSCCFCEKAFIQKSNLAAHMETHSIQGNTAGQTVVRARRKRRPPHIEGDV